MDGYGIAFAVLLGAMAVVLANVQAFASDAVRRERYVRGGVLKPGDTPDVDATAAFIAREKARERLALAGSAVVVAVAAVALALAGPPPTVQAVGFVVLTAAFFGRAVVIAVLGAREALDNRAPGPRASHGRVGSLGDYVSVLPWGLAAVLHLAFLAAYVPRSLALRPDLAGWVLALGSISLIALVGAWLLALWVARQPQLAASAGELAWSDAIRSRDLTGLLLTGPFLAVGVSISAFAYGGSGSAGEPVGWLPAITVGYLVTVGAVAIWGGVLARRRATPGPRTGELDHARR